MHGFNVPYPQWKAQAHHALENVVSAAITERATILFPGNVYGLGPNFEQPLAEDCRREAPTDKGRLRNELEQSLQAACNHGARAIVLRAGDYLGPNTKNTWFDHITKNARRGGAIVDPAPIGVPHEWAYLPDLAHAAADLLDLRGELAAHADFHFAGYAVDSATLIRAVRKALGDNQRKVKRMAWWPLKLLSPLVPLTKELVEMRYLFEHPVLLDGSKLQTVLGSPRKTPLDQAVASVLNAAAALT